MDAKENFIKNILINKIIANNENKFRNFKLIDSELNLPKNIDGFVSFIYSLKLHFQSTLKQNDTKVINLIIKLIRFDDEAKENSNICEQFKNEILIYSKVLPYYEQVLESVNASFRVSNLIPEIYYADFGIFPELGPTNESILVMGNLTCKNYRLGPRLHLDGDHVLMMAKAIGQYHSLSYGLKLKGDQRHQELVNEIYPISFLKDDGDVEDFNHLYIVAFERLFNYLERATHHFANNEKLKQDLDMYKAKYANETFRLLEMIKLCNKHDGDDFYKIILHGDYYRNNVMFEYDRPEGFENPRSIKIFDFQELRYSTPAIDLSYYMFMNMNECGYTELWDKVLQCYHDALTNGIVEVLQTTKNDSRLERLSYANFLKHFQNYGIYGACIAIHFTPWIACSEEDCQQFSELSFSSLHTQELYDLTMRAGGDTTNEYIVAVAKQASRLGLFDNWY